MVLVKQFGLIGKYDNTFHDSMLWRVYESLLLFRSNAIMLYCEHKLREIYGDGSV